MKTAIFIHAHEKDKVVFFSSLSQFLREKGFRTLHLVFSRYEKELYENCGIKDIIFMPRVLKNYSFELSNDEKLFNIDEILSYNIQLNEMNHFKFNKAETYKNIKRFINFLKNIHRENKIDLMVTWNNTFMFDSAAKRFSDENKIKHLMFEAGIFRPYTFTLDFQGINYGNSVPQNKEFYYNWMRNNQLNDNLETRLKVEELYPFNTPPLKKLYLKERMRDVLYRRYLNIDLELEIIHETLLQKVKKNVKKGLLNKTNEKTVVKQLPANFIFVPFQVHDDSQVLINSDRVKNMESLVEIMDREIRKLNALTNNKYYCVFKEHPADNGRIDYTGLYEKYKSNEYLIFMKDYDTSELIKKSKLIITINSTVGIEALENFKKVITLGNAYYNIEDIVWHCPSTEQLHQCINNVLKEEVNKELVSSFLNYLRFEYQVEGDWRKGLFHQKKLEQKLVENDIY